MTARVWIATAAVLLAVLGVGLATAEWDRAEPQRADSGWLEELLGDGLQ